MMDSEVETGDCMEQVWHEFSARRDQRWRRGVSEYRGGAGQFVGDAALEAQEEVVDLANYVGQLLDEQRITREEYERIEAQAFDVFQWLERVRQDSRQ